jgi:integrase
MVKNTKIRLNTAKSESKSEKRTFSKTHLGYWEKAIFRLPEGDNWYAQIQHHGRREKLSLGTPDKPDAVVRARDFYRSLMGKGWDEALRQLRPETSAAPRSRSTIGDFLDELKAKADIDAQTLEGYCVALRKIVSDAFGIDGGREKFDYRGGGRERWIERVHRVKLADLTPAVVQKWKRNFLARAGDDPTRLRAAKISVNSFLRRAKSLFAPRAIKHLSIKLPPSPFEGVKFEPRQSQRYFSTINAEQLIAAARDELAQSDPPVFIAFALMIFAGLRRNEVDKLEWSAFRWDQNIVRIETTRHLRVKTEHSIGDVSVDPELIEILRGYAAKASSDFVIESENSPRTGYRAELVFERLIAWLRSKGVTAKKPLHTLRKECGSLVNRRFGLSAARDVLRHASITITAEHYIDRARRATTGLGHLLKPADDKKIVPLEQPTAPDSSGKISKPKSA